MPENNSDNSQTTELEELELKAARLRLRLLTMALTLGRGCLIFFLVLCGLALLYFTLDVLEHVHIVAGMTAIATLAAYVLAPSVNYLNRKKGLNRILSITIIYLVLGLVIGTCGAFLVPVLKQQFVSLTETITNFSQSTPEQLLAMAKKMRDSAPESFRPSIDAFIAEHQQDGNLIPKLQSELRDKLPNLLGGTFSGVFSGVKTAVSGLLATVLIPLFTFYILMDSERYYNSVVRLVPRRFKSDAQELLHDIDQVLGSYIRGQLMVCATIGFSIGVALNLIGLEYATLIGLFAGVVDIIPYVGVAIGMIPAALVAWINHGFLWMLFCDSRDGGRPLDRRAYHRSRHHRSLGRTSALGRDDRSGRWR